MANIKKLNTKSSQVAQVPEYFFDDDHPDPNPSFWCKDDIMSEGRKFNPTGGFFFYKKSKKKFGELKPVYLCVHKQYLIASKGKEWASKQYKSLDISKHFVTIQKIHASSIKYTAGISLSYNQKQIELYCKGMEDLNAFLYSFKKSAIQINFEDMYTLDRKLGSGSYADVYRVRDKLTRREYAAKFFDISSFKDVNRSRIALKNEIIIHRQLEHGNICRLHEVYESPTHIILVMEYAKGERLIDYVISNSPLSEKEAMVIIKELLEAVGYLHSLGIIHRDLKLENVLIKKENTEQERLTVRLIDFGLSVTANNIELFKRSGTPGYVAPEILTTDTYDLKVDVFSLGVILFTMLSGRSPFVGPDRVSVLKLNKRCEYSFKPKYWDTKSAECKDLVKSMMELDPEVRFNTKQALSHKWFEPLNTSGGSVTTFSRLLTTKKSTVVQGSQNLDTNSILDKNFDKSKTATTEKPFKELGRPQTEAHPRNVSNSPARSNSAHRPESQTSIPGFKRPLTHQKSNLLQIPQQTLMFASFEDENGSEYGMPFDGINKGSIRSFYKLDSAIISEGPPSDRPDFDDDNAQEIPLENPDLNKRVRNMREMDKTLKSPFRSTSKSFDTSADAAKKYSCDISVTYMEESSNSNSPVPRYPTSFKANMQYVKMSSKLQD